MLVALLAQPSLAYAHDLGFDSDLDENGIVQFANPEGIRPAVFTAAINDWNDKVLTGIQQGPIIVDVTDNPGAFVEVIAANRGGDSASYYSRTVFSTHPDQIQISARFADLSSAKKVGTITHEFGHTRGHEHTEESYCSSSIMPTRAACNDAGKTRREDVGPHDVSDTYDLWYGPAATHPVHNKCWTNADSNGDGICNVYGPPPANEPLPILLVEPPPPPTV